MEELEWPETVLETCQVCMDAITCVFDRPGNYIALGTESGTIAILDFLTKQIVRMLQPPLVKRSQLSSTITSLRFVGSFGCTSHDLV